MITGVFPPAALKILENIDAGHSGQIPVEHNHVVLSHFQGVVTIEAVVEGLNRVALSGEAITDSHCQVYIVFD
jgi:hypothetical protein